MTRNRKFLRVDHCTPEQDISVNAHHNDLLGKTPKVSSAESESVENPECQHTDATENVRSRRKLKKPIWFKDYVDE